MNRSATAVDTSVAVAAASPWHDAHGAATEVLHQRPRLISHVAVETYSVLTRLPGHRRLAAGAAREFLKWNFNDPLLTLPARGLQQALDAMADRDVRGGAVYDALIAATAVHHAVVLVTRDARAAQTYDAMGCEARMLG